LPSVPRLWPGATVAILASGPSLTREDVEFVRGKVPVIAINATYALAPWADVMYGADAKVFRWYWKKGPAGFEDLPLRACSSLKYSLTKGAEVYGNVTILRRGQREGLSLNPAILNTGDNSGYQAINFAVLAGASRILLLGYDMQKGPAGEEHWHADHPNHSRSPYQKFRVHFNGMIEPLKAAGVEVVNCSPRTALTCFPRMPLRKALAPIEAVA